MRSLGVHATILLQVCLLLSGHLQAQSPKTTSNCSAGIVVSAASYYGRIAPDSIASIFGSSLSARAEAGVPDALGQMPFEVAGTSVSVNGKAARIFYVSAGMVNFLVPAETSFGAPATVEVRAKSMGQTTVATVDVSLAAPGIFMTGSFRGDRAAARNAVTFGVEPFTVTTAENFGQDKKTRLAVFATGVRYAGQSSAVSPANFNVAASVLVDARASSGATYSLPVEYAGPAPLFPGLDQLNVVLPDNLRREDIVRVRIRTGITYSNWTSLAIGTSLPSPSHGLQYSITSFAPSVQMAGGSMVSTDVLGNPILFEASQGIVQRVGRDGSILAKQTLAGFSEGPRNPQLLGGLASDVSGNVYLADTAGHRVLRVEPNGDVQTIAGTGVSGFSGDGGAASDAQLNSPTWIALSRQGHVYIADTGNNRIRVISPSGFIHTLAGTGRSGFHGDGGPALAADLNGPQGLAADGSGNLYIADTGNNRIRLVTPEGLIVSIAGNGIGASTEEGQYAVLASLTQPVAVALDRLGSFYILEANSHRVKKVSSDGVIASLSTTGLPAVHSLSVDANGDVFLTTAERGLLRLHMEGQMETANPALLSLVSPSLSLVGGCATVATLTLGSPAPEGGALVRLESSTRSLQVPSAVFVAPGATSIAFLVNPVWGSSQSSGTVRAHLESSVTELTLGVQPAVPVQLAGLAVAPGVVTSGSPVSLTVSLNGLAPSGGAVVTLRSDNPAVQLPSSIKIGGGDHSLAVLVQTTAAVSRQTVRITAEYSGSSQYIELIVNAGVQGSGGQNQSVASLAVSKSVLTGVDSATGTLTLSRPAVAPGVDVSLQASSAALQIPTSVKINAGETSTTFPISSSAVAAEVLVTLTALLDGSQASAAVVLQPSSSQPVGGTASVNLALSQTRMTDNDTASGILTLTPAAPAGGTQVSLTSSSNAVRIPSSLVVGSGDRTASFPISANPVTAATTVVITATTSGSHSSQTIVVEPAASQSPVTLQSLSVSPSQITGGSSGTGTISLSNSAPPQGTVVSLSSANGVVQVPAMVTIPAAQTTANFAFTTTSVTSAATVEIAATLAGARTTATVIVAPTPSNAVTVASVAFSALSVVSEASLTGTVTLSGPAPNGGVAVNLQSNNGAAQVPASLLIAAGASSGTFPVSTSNVSGPTSVIVTAGANGSSASASFTITPANTGNNLSQIASVSTSPSVLTAGSSGTGMVTLTRPAPAEGVTVQLQADNSAVQVPASISISAGQTTGTFAIASSAATFTGPVLIRATANGSSGTATVTINAAPVNAVTVSSVSLALAAVTGPASVPGTVTLSGPAANGGVTVNLQSSVGFAQVPPSVIIAAGQTSGSFTLSVAAVTSQVSATITAMVNGSSASTSVTLQAPLLQIAGLALSPSTVVGGGGVSGSVTLSGVAPTGGLTVNLQSSNPTVSVPATVTIAQGTNSVSFSVTTTAVTSTSTVIISASVNGSSSSATLTINPPAPGPSKVVSVELPASSVTGGSNANGSVTLSAPAPSGGLTVTLTSNHSAAQVPGSISIGANQVTGSFVVNTSTVSSQTPVVITAAGNGGTASANLTILAAANPCVSTLQLVPSITDLLSGNGHITGTLVLSGPAPQSGLHVDIRAGATILGTVQVSGGQTSASVNLSVASLLSLIGSGVSAFTGGTCQAVTVVLNLSPAKLGQITLSPASVTGGVSVTGTVTLLSPSAAGGTVVSLSSSNGAVQVPASVTVPSGQLTQSFAVSTSAVSSETIGVVTASANGGSATASLTVQVAQATASLGSLTINPAAVIGGASATGTITLTAPAAVGGASIALQSGHPAAQIPASVMIPAGQSSATFAIATTSVSTATAAVITGSFHAATVSASLTVNAPANPCVSGLNLSVNITNLLSGAGLLTGTVTLTGPAPSGGLPIQFVSGSANLGSAIVPEGQSATSISLSVGNLLSLVGSAVQALTAAPCGGVSVNLQLSSTLVGSVVLAQANVTGSVGTTATIHLAAPAPVGGATVSLSSSHAAVSVPASVTIPAGSLTATISVTTTNPALLQVVTITATAGNSQTALLTLNPAVALAVPIAGVSLNVASIIGSGSVQGTITLTSPAPEGGALVTLAASSSALGLPASLVIAAGQTSATFSISTTAVASSLLATITATSANSLTGTFTVASPCVQGITLSVSSLLGGTGASGTVVLNGPAPAGGSAVALVYAGAGITGPASIVVPQGATTANFAVSTSPVVAIVSGVLTATLGSCGGVAVNLSVEAPALSSLAIAPATVNLLGHATGTVTLTGPAPAGGIVVALSSGIASNLLGMPTSVTVPAGATSAQFNINNLISVLSGLLNPIVGSVNASLGGVVRNASLTLRVL